MPRGHGALAMWGIPFYDRIQRARVMSQPIDRYGELSSMMTWAETAARNEHVTREEADRWALRSHKRAVAAQDTGKFAEEIVPVVVGKDKAGTPILFATDEGPRRDTSLEPARTPPPCVCRRRMYRGKFIIGNDGAAVVVLASEKKAQSLG